MRILIGAHAWSFGHPGGAEHAATNLARSLGELGHEVRLVACVPDLDHDLGYDSSGDVVLIRSSTVPQSYLWADPQTAATWSRVLVDFAPDVVHLHHYVNLGAELPLVAKQSVPDCAVALTLHEYLAICPRDGQMVDAQGQLCSSSGTRKCAACFGTTADSIALNELTLKALFKHVDRVVAPSEFLRDRYIAWGLPGDRIDCLPNVVRPPSASPSVATASNSVRFVFMSQHTPHKGVDVLLRALQLLQRTDSELVHRCTVDIWGSGIERFGQDWADRLKDLMDGLDGWVSFRGAYGPDQVESIYAGADWTIVPSIWWENRPLVIEESLSLGVPVITSNIGGMAELLTEPSLGITCAPNDPHALAAAIADAARRPREQVRYRATHSAHSHVQLYERILGARP